MILRHLANKDPQGLSVTSDAVTDACQALVGPTAHSRLLVLSGIPTHLEEAVVRSAIRRACNAHGGLFKDEIFIPLQEEDPKKPKPTAASTQAGPRDAKPGPEPERPSPGGPESPDSSSSLTPAMSVSASASTSQTSICSSSQGVSRTTSELSVDQESLAGPPPPPGQTAATASATASAGSYPHSGPPEPQERVQPGKPGHLPVQHGEPGQSGQPGGDAGQRGRGVCVRRRLHVHRRLHGQQCGPDPAHQGLCCHRGGWCAREMLTGEPRENGHCL